MKKNALVAALVAFGVSTVTASAGLPTPVPHPNVHISFGQEHQQNQKIQDLHSRLTDVENVTDWIRMCLVGSEQPKVTTVSGRMVVVFQVQPVCLSAENAMAPKTA